MLNFTRSDFRELEPATGRGYVCLDVTDVLPKFILQAESALQRLSNGTWAFDGDPDVPHYVDLNATKTELKRIIGEDHFAQLSVFSHLITANIKMNLPTLELERLKAANVEICLDLAELRISDGSKRNTAQNIHLDLLPREGMVLVIPLTGKPTTIFHPDVKKPLVDNSNRIVATLLTAYERWWRFHDYDFNTNISGSRTMKIADHNVIVPKGMVNYLQTKGTVIPEDIYPNFPGVLPTIHAAGEGARTVIILNYSYVPIGNKINFTHS